MIQKCALKVFYTRSVLHDRRFTPKTLFVFCLRAIIEKRKAQTAKHITTQVSVTVHCALPIYFFR